MMSFMSNENHNQILHPILMPQIHMNLKVMGSPSATPTRLMVDIREEFSKPEVICGIFKQDMLEQPKSLFTMPCSEADPVPSGTG